MAKKSQKGEPKKPEWKAAERFAESQPPEMRACAIYSFLQGYQAGHRAHIEEAAGLQAVVEEALSMVPEGEWRELMKEWLDYHRSIRKPYTTINGIMEVYHKLHDTLEADIEAARRCVHDSITNRYIGLFPDNYARKQYPTRPTEQRKEGVRNLSRAASVGISALAEFYGDEE